MNIRYMGTKRHLAPHIREIANGLPDRNRTADLFAGIGTVSAALSETSPVIANDLSAFINCILRAQLLNQTFLQCDGELTELYRHYNQAFNRFSEHNKARLKKEAAALQASDWKMLAEFMEAVPHAGNNGSLRAQADMSKASSDIDRFKLTQFYFAGSYVSLHQAIQIDALRYAIASVDPNNDILLSLWLGAINDAVNAPGHTANFIHAHDEKSAARVRRAWSIDVHHHFERRYRLFEQIGTTTWRGKNRVSNLEARRLLSSNFKFDLVYADPPYTKDHYSRYYHLYETLYLYDFPESTGRGRYREDRFLSDFSLKSKVVEAFRDLFRLTALRRVPLILSYPSDGLLTKAGHTVEELASEQFKQVDVYCVGTVHSTLGARQGSSTKTAAENVYLCR